MRKVSTLLFFCFISAVSFSQTWIRYYGVGQQSQGTYCIHHYDKGYILGGGVNNFKYGWLIKTDVNGSVLWDIKIGDGAHLTGIDAVENTNDNGLILCGSTNIANPPHTDPYIMKLNACGEVEWCKILVYDNTGDGGMSVKPTGDGGFVLLGIFYGNDPDDRIRLFKFDSGGDVCWVKIYNRDSIVRNEDVRNLIVDSANFLITGFCYYPGWLKPYFIQTDTSGNETWRLAYSQHTGLGYIGEVRETNRDHFGNYYAAGTRETSPELLKFSSQGYEMMNIDLFPNSTGGFGYTICIDSDTSLIMTASWSIDSVQIGILRLDTSGVIRKCKVFPSKTSVPYHSIKTLDDKFLVFGEETNGSPMYMSLQKFNSSLEYDSVYPGQYTYDSLCPDTIHSHVIYPACDIIVGLEDPLEFSEKSMLKVYPIPATNGLTIEFPENLVVMSGTTSSGSTTIYQKWKSTILQVYDNSGKMIFHKEIIRAEKSLQVDVSGWRRGMYFIRLRFNQKEVATAKCLVE